MADFAKVVGLTLLAGMAMPLGAILAVRFSRRDSSPPEIETGIMAFGGGALLSAVALVLVPEGIENLSILPVAIAFLSGGIGFMLLDVYLAKHKSPVSQLVAMLSDFLPEAIALGASLAVGSPTCLLLAGLMALQNLPEGFNSFRELSRGGRLRDRQIVTAFLLLALLGPMCGILGFYLLSEQTTLVSVLMLFAAGGILYVVFGDIAPQAKLENNWLPPLGAVAGFLLGLIGQMLTG